MRLERIRFSSLVAVLTALLLGACSTEPDWSAVRPARAPVVKEQTTQIELSYPPRSEALASGEARRLDGFLTQVKAQGASVVAFAVSSGTLQTPRHAVLMRRLAEWGFDTQVRITELSGDSAKDDTAILVAYFYTATLPECPDWTGYPGTTFDNQPSSNFGCANASNLGLMVADPSDLHHGRTIGPADGTVGARAIERYRSGTSPQLSGTVSPAAPNGAPSSGKGSGGASGASMTTGTGG